MKKIMIDHSVNETEILEVMIVDLHSNDLMVQKKCIKQHALNATTLAKFLSNQLKENQFSARIASVRNEDFRFLIF
jgi:hypothetical protein